MSVQISELEVVPRPQGEGEQKPAPSQPAAPSTELEREIAHTVALLRSRNLRLRAD